MKSPEITSTMPTTTGVRLTNSPESGPALHVEFSNGRSVVVPLPYDATPNRIAHLLATAQDQLLDMTIKGLTNA